MVRWPEALQVIQTAYLGHVVNIVPYFLGPSILVHLLARKIDIPTSSIYDIRFVHISHHLLLFVLFFL